MTEPEVASSDATNIKTSIRRDGDSYVINGRKWWSSGVSACGVGVSDGVGGRAGVSCGFASREGEVSVINSSTDASGGALGRVRAWRVKG